MAKLPTRAQLIKRGKQLRTLQITSLKFQLLFMSAKKKRLRKEIFIETDFGRARMLWYGYKNLNMAPVYFDLHDGGFVVGSADMDQAMNLEISKQVGCKIISIDYAKAPKFPYPAAVNQIYAVVRHVFENADKYAIDGEKMAIGGHSAGGTLSTVTCMKASKAGDFQFVCQVLDYPPTDLATNPYEKTHPKGSVPADMEMVFNACYVDPDQAKDPYVSPVYATHGELEGMPPALFILAGHDSLHDEGLKYCGMLNTAGVATECHEYPNTGHGFTYQASSDTSDAWAKMATFLKKYLYQADV
jgi:acetyl esterase